MAGLTPEGFDIKDLETILTEIESDQLANIDADLNVEADSIAGQLNGIIAAQLFELWELAEQVYQAAYPDTATGQALSYIAALTGTIRSPATKTVIEVSCVSSPPVTLPLGTAVYVTSDPASRYELLEAVELTATPQTVKFTASTAGSATTIVNGDPLTIETPVNDWDSATYVNDSILQGADEETDAELRARREDEVARPGTGTVDAIRTDVLADVEGVTSCTVFENVTGTPDVTGLPGHSIEVMVTGTYDDDELAQEIWDNKPAGTGTHGTESGTANDTASPSNAHILYFSNPTEVPLHVAMTLVTDSNYTGADSVTNPLLAWFQDLGVGQFVYSSDIIEVVKDVAGVLDVTANLCFVKNSDPPTGSFQYDTGPREIGTLIPADIDIVIA